MKIRTSFLLLLILLVAISLATTRRVSATAPIHGPSAFGEGAFSFFNGFRLEQWSYTFEAETNPNGHVHGRAMFELADTDVPIVTHVVVKITCLNVLVSPDSLAASISAMTRTRSRVSQRPTASEIGAWTSPGSTRRAGGSRTAGSSPR